MKSGEFRQVLWRDNPLLVYLVGLCPALAVSDRLVNALLLAAVMLFALVGTGIAGFGLERLAPPRLRLPVRLLLASVLVTAAQRFLWAFAPTLTGRLGIYLPLLAVNCLLLGSAGAGASASARSFSEEVLEAAGRGAAFAAGLAMLALLREALGAGTITLFPIGSFGGVLRIRGLPPARVLAAAPGALLLLGYLGALARWWSGRRS
jgi:electron transport complex protein RnfE